MTLDWPLSSFPFFLSPLFLYNHGLIVDSRRKVAPRKCRPSLLGGELSFCIRFEFFFAPTLFCQRVPGRIGALQGCFGFVLRALVVAVPPFFIFVEIDFPLIL